MAFLDDVLKEIPDETNTDPEKRGKSDSDEKKLAFTYGSEFDEFAKQGK